LAANHPSSPSSSSSLSNLIAHSNLFSGIREWIANPKQPQHHPSLQEASSSNPKKEK
jgi:hypothetical protein